MEGLYLYCIREKTENAPEISIKGIDGEGETYTLLFRDLEAVVSRVSLEEFASEEIQRKAQEDLNWIKEKAVIHEKVVEEAMRKNGKILNLVPMRFGTIFQDKVRLEEILKKDYSRVEEVLERIRGKQEWSVKLYLGDREKFKQMIKKNNETIVEKEREIASLPEGMAFFVEEELKEVISKEVEKELNKMMEGVFESLKKQAVTAVKSKILGKELIGRQEPMVLNAAYLVLEEKMEDYRKEAEDLNHKMQEKGFFIEYSGPWPAYNFTPLEIGKK
jgi:uncharacterized protein YcgL (UPF0745 family)